MSKESEFNSAFRELVKQECMAFIEPFREQAEKLAYENRALRIELQVMTNAFERACQQNAILRAAVPSKGSLFDGEQATSGTVSASSPP